MSSTSLRKLALDLCWRQWSTMGVAGVVRQEGNAVIDPESLVLFTGALARLDPRLRNEAIDWCVSHGSRVISTSRMKNLKLKMKGPDVDRFLASVNHAAGTKWPASKGAKAWHYELSGKSQLRRPEKEQALARVQLRALFGVSARAEVVLAMSTSGHNRFVSASALTSTGYSKRNIAFVLDDLERASLLKRRASGNQVLYRLSKAGHLHKLSPCTSGAILVRWDLMFPIILDAMTFLEKVANASPSVCSVEAQKFIQSHQPSIDMLSLDTPALERGNEQEYGAAITSWLGTSLVPSSWQ